jgi:hypothetical protein
MSDEFMISLLRHHAMGYAAYEEAQVALETATEGLGTETSMQQGMGLIGATRRLGTQVEATTDLIKANSHQGRLINTVLGEVAKWQGVINKADTFIAANF